MTATDGPGHFKFVPGFVRQNAGKEEIYMLEEESSRKRSRKQQEEEPFSWKKEIISWIQIIVAAVIIALVLNNFIIANSRVPTGSMENTIMSKSRVIGSRLAYLTSDPERGDVVIFHFPDDPTGKIYYVKRVIGLPGETVNVVDGKVYINDSDTPLDEPYLPEPMEGSYGPYTVPEGCYFMMGDNRNNSWMPGSGRTGSWRRTRL